MLKYQMPCVSLHKRSQAILVDTKIEQSWGIPQAGIHERTRLSPIPQGFHALFLDLPSLSWILEQGTIYWSKLQANYKMKHQKFIFYLQILKIIFSKLFSM